MKIFYGIVLFLISYVNVNAQAFLSKSDMVKIDFAQLAAKKKRLIKKDAALLPAYEALYKSCEKLLAMKPTSVVHKTAIPPSGNKHDYMSIAPYWWPDPSKADGLPYIRKDGVVNPETGDYSDKINMVQMAENVYILSLGYYYSEDERFARKAVELMNVWFVDTTTRMNPHLNYGQAVKGVVTGRAEGLIDTRHFIFMIDGIQLLKKSPAYTKPMDKSIKAWFNDFLNWMEESPIGKDELNAKNNHGIWYDAQALSITLFLNDTTHAHQILQRSLQRLQTQLDNKGYFPLEMERTTSFHYSVFILNAFTVIAQLAENLHIDMWHQTLKEGRSLEQAYTTILPYLLKEKTWEGQQIKHFDFENGYPLLLSAASKYGCKTCREFISTNSTNATALLVQLL